MANNWSDDEVLDLFDGLDVVCLGVEVRLGRGKVVVVDCLGLTESGAS